MPKVNLEENLVEVVGNYVIQLVKAQTLSNQLAEQLSAVQAELEKLKNATICHNNTGDSSPKGKRASA